MTLSAFTSESNILTKASMILTAGAQMCTGAELTLQSNPNRAHRDLINQTKIKAVWIPAAHQL